MSSKRSLDVTKARSFFSSLSSQVPHIYANNAGGTQCPKPVIDRIVDYLSNTNVQSGTDFSGTKTHSDRADLFHEATRILLNTSNTDEVVLGSTTTMLLASLASAMEGELDGRDEIIATGEHEGTHRLQWRFPSWRICQRFL